MYILRDGMSFLFNNIFGVKRKYEILEGVPHCEYVNSSKHVCGCPYVKKIEGIGYRCRTHDFEYQKEVKAENAARNEAKKKRLDEELKAAEERIAYRAKHGRSMPENEISDSDSEDDGSGYFMK